MTATSKRKAPHAAASDGRVEPAHGEGSPASEIPEGAAYRVTLPEFEGPLDLLLHLCKTHELDILNIPLAFVAQKYVEYLEAMTSITVEVAAEYLVMAAHLAYLKSRELVPTPEPLEPLVEEGQEALDPREELIRRLLEYQKYKDAAFKLGARPIEGRNVFLRGMEVAGWSDQGAGPIELAEHSPWKLIAAFSDILKKAGPQLTHDVTVDRISISDRINQIVDHLEAGKGSFRFDSIIDRELPEPELRHQLVVTLLAILELAKLRAIRVLHDPVSETFLIAHVPEVSLAEARRLEPTVLEPTVDESAVETTQTREPDGPT